MVKLLDIVKKFCSKTNFNINTDKSVYTCNLPTVADIEWEFKGSKSNLKKTVGTEANRFLGVWITLDLNWDVQYGKAVNNLKMNLSKLGDINFSIGQRITILNSIIFPYIRYGMSYVNYSNDQINEMEKLVNFQFNSKLGINLNVSKERYFGHNRDGGMGLISLKDMQKISYLTSILNRGVNFDSVYPRVLFGENYLVRVEKSSRQQSLYILNNGSIENMYDLASSIGYTLAGWTEPMDQREYDYKLGEDEDEQEKEDYIKRIKAEKIKKYTLIGTDGSFTDDGKAGCGVSFHTTIEEGKLFWRTTLCQTGLGAELEAILYAITYVPEKLDILIASDSLNSINLIKKTHYSNRERNSLEEYPIVENIKAVIEKRSGEVLIEYVPAHQGEDSTKHKIDKINERNAQINIDYGWRAAEKFMFVNKEADRVADKGTKNIRDCFQPGSVEKGFPEIYLIDPEGFPIGGNYKGLLKKILNLKNINNLGKRYHHDTTEFIKYNSINKKFKNKLLEFDFKLKAGNLNFGYQKNRLCPNNFKNYYHAFKSISDPSSFCEFGCCNENEVLNDKHLFNSCKNEEIVTIRKSILENTKKVLVTNNFIKKRKLESKVEEMKEWWEIANYESYKENKDIIDVIITEEDLPNNYLKVVDDCT